MKTYGANLIAPLVICWEAADYACGERLKPFLKNEVTRLRSFNELTVTDEQTAALLRMSESTIDRLLKHERSVRRLREKYVKSKNPLLYQIIPTKLSDEFDRVKPGDMQLDAVEHCGVSSKGQYVSTVTAICAASYWWEGRAIMGKGQAATLGAIKINRANSPFIWVGASPDNGTSFINYFFYAYALATNLDPSRSRPYHKNDNCFVEQTNRDNVRDFVGSVRYDSQEELRILNELYDLLRLYKNFFQPVIRLQTKIRDKGKIHRKYQKAKTPYHWLLADPHTSEETKQALVLKYESLNPALLKRQINNKLQELAKVYQAKQAKATARVEVPSVTFLRDVTAPSTVVSVT